MAQRLRQRTRPAVRQRQAAAVRLAGLLEVSDAAAARAARALYRDPLYSRLRALGVIVYRRRAGFGFAGSAELVDQLPAIDREPVPFPRLDPAVLARVRSLGRERFERLFLGDQPLDDSSLAAAAGLAVADVRAIRQSLDAAALADDLRSLPTEGGSRMSYRRVARIEFSGDRFAILLYHPELARGDIIVRREMLDAAILSGALTAEEAQAAMSLVSRVEDLGRRASLLFRILEEVVRVQERFLRTGREEDLVACSRRDMARRLAVHQSLVARAVYGRSVVVPSGQEIPLAALLRPSSAVVAARIARILSDGVRRTDRQLCQELCRRYGVEVPRRTVAYHRRRLDGRDRS